MHELGHPDDAAGFLAGLASGSSPNGRVIAGWAARAASKLVRGATAEAGFEGLDLLGTLPPLAASWLITCLMSQMFIVPKSLVSPV